MWNRIKEWFTSKRDSTTGPSNEHSKYAFKWYEVGDNNPFGIRVLDVRSLTQNVLAVTKDPRVAETFNAQRRSNGREYIDAPIGNSQWISCDLTFPHNGEPLEGVVFKADSMEVKWDIYIYDSVFLFVRSWTGQLQYRAKAHIGMNSITINAIEASTDLAPTGAQAVYVLLGTHGLGRVLPHTVPHSTPADEQQIALLSFSMYGNRGCFATFDDVTQVPILQPNS